MSQFNENLAAHLYAMKLGDECEATHGTYVRIPGGWTYTTKHKNEFVIPYTTEFKPKSKKPEQTEIEIPSTELERLIEFWNTKDIVKCKGVTEGIKKAYLKAKKNFSKELIAQAINNYTVVLKDQGYYLDTYWGLEKFLKQSNCIPDFINTGEKWINYKKSTEGASNQELGQVPAHLRKNKS